MEALITVPRISIITVTYNASAVLESTLASVKKITYSNLEYIIIDGCSKDDTIKIIDNYKEQVNHFISEPDNGVFDAMNKGIKLSTGDWVIFLNAGDLIYDSNIFSKMELLNNEGIGLIYGNTYDIGVGIRKPFQLNSLKYGMIMACHQSMIFNKKVLKDQLYYDNSYKFYNDYELVVRIIKSYKVIYVNHVIASYLGGGISSKISWRARYDKYKMMFKLFNFKGIISALMLKVGYKPF